MVKIPVHAIQSGILYGYAGLVDGIVKRMKKEIRSRNIKVVATGGMAEQIAENSETIDHIDKLLTLEGLRIIYERNKN